MRGWGSMSLTAIFIIETAILEVYDVYGPGTQYRAVKFILRDLKVAP